MTVPRSGLASVAALRSPRYELIPIDGVLEQVPYIPTSAQVTITSSPAKGIEPTIALAEALSQRGLRVTPHLAARSFLSDAHVASVIDRLITSGITDIYVIGGDAPRPAGPLTQARDLLIRIAELGAPFKHIGIAAYPEGHPLIASHRLWELLREKQRYATYIVTQMCFDAETIHAWIAEARRQMIHLPVWVGLPGVASTTRIARVAGRIGVGQSFRFLRKNIGLLPRFFRPGMYQPDELVDGLDRTFRHPGLDVRGYHIYTFNAVETTEQWRTQRMHANQPAAIGDAAF